MRTRTALGPYIELAAYLKPYRGVFAFGTLCGLLFGAVSGAIPVVINFVGTVVFSGSSDADLVSSLSSMGLLGSALRDFATGVLHLDHVSKSLVVTVACLLIPGVMMLRSILDFLNNYCSEWASLRVLTDLRGKLMERITSQSLDFFNESKAGNLFQRIINETREAQTILTVINTQLIAQPATMISGLIVLFKLDWKFTVGALVLMPCCIFPVLYLGKKIRQSAMREHGEERDMMVILHEMIAGIKVIKAFARVPYELERFNSSGRMQFRQAMRARRMMETTTPVVESLAAIGVALGLFYVYSVGMSGSTFLSLCVGIFLIYHPLKTLSKSHLILSRSHGVLLALFDMMRRKPSVCDAPDARAIEQGRGEIVFENVTFGYREGIPALQNFSFRFEPGKHYALVGESGAGKSTLFALIMRFYDPQHGRVCFDGYDVRGLAQDSLRRQIGVVSQDTFLFHESIRKNIAYGRLDASEEEIISAARRAHAHEFILAQQRGYQTIVGDKGCMLSGGQQQRIAIARALLKNAPVLLFDEATSALDSVSEKQIQEALENLGSGRTVIAIAHRLSTILKADCILVLDKGRLCEAGTHDDLLSRSGIYRRLCELQFGNGSASQ